MRKLAIVVAAAVLAFALASCSDEMREISKTELGDGCVLRTMQSDFGARAYVATCPKGDASVTYRDGKVERNVQTVGR